MIRFTCLGLALALCAAMWGCADAMVTTTPSPPTTAPSDVTVKIDNFTFDPPTLTIPRGTKVTWLNRDDVPHTATSSASPKAFNSKALDTDDKFSFVFTTPGNYPYFCAIHPHMTATIVVK